MPPAPRLAPRLLCPECRLRRCGTNKARCGPCQSRARNARGPGASLSAEQRRALRARPSVALAGPTVPGGRWASNRWLAHPDRSAPLLASEVLAVFHDREGPSRREILDCRPQRWCRLEGALGALTARTWDLVEIVDGIAVYAERAPAPYVYPASLGAPSDAEPAA